MPDRPVVLLGPSLAWEKARALLPGALLLPPARRSSLKPFFDDPPSAIGIIDGEFYQSFAISPKEILPFLDRGIPVFGASSMGALRAVELEGEGMIGVGRIYEMFSRGELEADDEVAMTFCPETLRPVSEPMVNFRVALAAAETAGLLSSPESAELAQAVHSLYFPGRTVQALFSAAGRVLGERAAPFREWWLASSPNAKAEDARELLRRMRRTAPPAWT
jgi:hypothetical protein